MRGRVTAKTWSIIAVQCHLRRRRKARGKESSFSLSGNTVTKLRHTLGPKTLAALVIVGAHIRKHGDLEMEDPE